MDQFAEITGPELFWAQPKTFERWFELRTPAASLAGLLVWEKALGTLATASTKGIQWSFKRVGFWNPRITIRRLGQENDQGIFYPRFFGNGTLEMSSGRQFRWEALNFWATQWGFFNSHEDQALVKFLPGSEKSGLREIFKNQAIVEIDPVRQTDELPLLITLGWYLIILRQDDSTTAIAATSAAS